MNIKCLNCENNHKKNSRFVAILLIIIAQVVSLCLFCNSKEEYHIDEIYSYILSNSYDADRISNADEKWNTWIEGKDFADFVSVQDGEGFSYKTVYYNNSKDCHPPLYYWALHTICSFFPNIFSKWFGLALNVICFVIADILVYCISSELIKSEKLRLIPLVLYGFSTFAIDTVTFIRMYMLQTVFVLLFVLLGIRIINKGLTYKRLVLLCINIFLGGLTHYYSILVSFWGVLIIALYLLKKRYYKKTILLCSLSLLAVALIIITYPYILIQATGSSTNNIGNEVSKNLFNFKLWIVMTVELIKEFLASFSYSPVLSLIVLAGIIVTSVVVALKSTDKITRISLLSDNKDLVFLIALFVTVFLSISFIGGEYVYLRYIYPIMPVFYCIFTSFFDRMTNGKTVIRTAVVSMLVTFSLFNLIVTYDYSNTSFLYHYLVEDNSKILEYSDTPMIVITGEDSHSTAIPTGNFTVYSKFDKLYMTSLNEAIDSDIFNDTLKNNESIVLCIATDDYWCDGLEIKNVLEELEPIRNVKYSEIGKRSLVTYYLVN